ncbi:methyl-accepting chemotaxis protein [Aquirhabdus parva]|uniref:Methyl-accepting chemotaxis protein n=1 Tax=Aquirhabdus parva TaxID=2283318 RepID=A0A345P7U8_9GAMM|nr:methyl-accepting chemotaxis protein [Aquirhabdus parva]AXI03357.1 methyl-accepting chemotaxis protein [Aquirhabdus parva]
MSFRRSNVSTNVKKKINTNALSHQASTAKQRLTQYIDQIAGSFGDAKKVKPLLLLAILALILFLFSLIYLAYTVPKSNKMVRDVGELRVLSEQISKNASEASTGSSDEAFKRLAISKKKFHDRLESLISNYGSSNDDMKAVLAAWKGTELGVNDILTNQDLVNNLHDVGVQTRDVVPLIQTNYNTITDQMVKSGAPASQVVFARNQVLLSERILKSITVVLSGDTTAISSASGFSDDAQTFGKVLQGQLKGDASLGIQAITDPTARTALAAVEKSYTDVLNPSAVKMFISSPQITQVRDSAKNLYAASADLLKRLDTLSGSVQTKYPTILPSALMLLGLIGLGYALIKMFMMRGRIDQERAMADAQKEAERARSIQAESERNQTAILRLLDELGDLADGDLTANATVSEDFTGAIADSVNFAIDQLRLLVSAINTTALQVAGSSQDTQQTAMQLAEASEHQAQEIAGASAAVNEIAVSIDQVSANAIESAAVAERSVEIAVNGGDVVQRSIEGMNIIRDQIQETAKRIKRLGESSQEIGDIVSLINDIADQTNILALNAAIQASMAGEAGRGFAVVADEVQRLAERSAGATKQIEGLVKAIQSDTNEAVISMEQTTSEVVRGAGLAQDAGIALDDVQKVSRTLADLIQNISSAARQQAASAGHISNTMNVIQEITTQTTAGTMATARSVGNLAEMAANLRESVSGFKLPDELTVH